MYLSSGLVYVPLEPDSSSSQTLTLPNTTEGKDVHNIMADIKIILYAYVLIITGKYLDARDIPKCMRSL